MEPTETDARRRRSSAASRIGGQLLLWIQDGAPERLALIRDDLDAAEGLDPLEPFGVTSDESETAPMTVTTDPISGRVPQIVGAVLLALVALFVITKDTGLMHGTVGDDFISHATTGQP